MKKKIFFIAAVLATCLTACSFFIKDDITEYECQVILEGGSGKASVQSPAQVSVSGEEKTVKLIWSSSNYDYMLVDDTRYDNEAGPDENSTFTISFKEFDTAFTVIGDTTAMSKPHEIEYQLTVLSPGNTKETAQEVSAPEAKGGSASLGSLKKTGSLKLDYATGFSVDYYEDEKGLTYAFIQTGDQKLLKVPDGWDKSLTISDNVTIIENTDKTYLVSTSVMDLMASIDAMDDIAFSGTKANDWDIKAAKAAMEDKKIAYAGKYSAPDYELLLSEECNFAIENTMIYHTPQTLEKLQEIGIPVLVEQSSYEASPLGRLEWIKLYGVLYGKEEEANSVFAQQVKRANAVEGLEKTGKTVAFFSINSNGQIIIRKPGDYISRMIDMAGASYVPKGVGTTEKNALSTMKITTEDFYLGAVDADILIYNSTIEGEITSVAQLTKLEASLNDFKAVKNGNVYCLREGYFQKTTNVAEFIEELHLILEGDFTEGQCFFILKE